MPTCMFCLRNHGIFVVIENRGTMHLGPCETRGRGLSDLSERKLIANARNNRLVSGIIRTEGF